MWQQWLLRWFRQLSQRTMDLLAPKTESICVFQHHSWVRHREAISPHKKTMLSANSIGNT